MNLENDIKQAMKIIIDSYSTNYDKNTNYDNMLTYSRIYQNTTENIKMYMPLLNGNYQSALLPTASADHQLEAILSGITKITCFDLNRLTKYFAELKFAAIKNLTKKEYINFMYENILNKDIFNYFKNSLTEDVLTFWKVLFEYFQPETICGYLFRNLKIKLDNKLIEGKEFSKYCVENFTNYLQDENYKIIQDRLEKVKIEYIEANLLDLTEKLNDTYDLINLSNIYEYVNEILNNGAQIFANVVKNLVNYLNDNGKIMITYLYSCSSKDIKKYEKKSILYALFLIKFNEMIENKYNKNSIDFIMNNPILKEAQQIITNKLCTFKNAQLFKYLKDINMVAYELTGTGLNCNTSPNDMALIYKKSKN